MPKRTAPTKRRHRAPNSVAHARRADAQFDAPTLTLCDRRRDRRRVDNRRLAFDQCSTRAQTTRRRQCSDLRTRPTRPPRRCAARARRASRASSRRQRCAVRDRARRCMLRVVHRERRPHCCALQRIGARRRQSRRASQMSLDSTSLIVLIVMHRVCGRRPDRVVVERSSFFWRLV